MDCVNTVPTNWCPQSVSVFWRAGNESEVQYHNRPAQEHDIDFEHAKSGSCIERNVITCSCESEWCLWIPFSRSYLPDYVWDVFEESVPMSTYLVAFVISDFQNRTNGNFSIWARNDGISAAEYALEVGPKILKFLEEFFGIPFPLPKIDMIALPDFHAGAMENWGLITFRYVEL